MPDGGPWTGMKRPVCPHQAGVEPTRLLQGNYTIGGSALLEDIGLAGTSDKLLKVQRLCIKAKSGCNFKAFISSAFIITVWKSQKHWLGINMGITK